ncbi:uncharacterized [Tachysurus ichikawai]
MSTKSKKAGHVTLQHAHVTLHTSSACVDDRMKQLRALNGFLRSSECLSEELRRGAAESSLIRKVEMFEEVG